MNATTTLALALALAACGEAALADVEPEPTSETLTVSAASLVDGVLQNCSDTTITFPTPEGVAQEERAREAAATFRNDIIRGRAGDQILPEGATCARTWAGRLAYAQCTMRKSAGRHSLESVKSIYVYEHVYDDESERLVCIGEGDEWQALPEDSYEVRRAYINSVSRELREGSRRIQELINAR